MNKKTIKIAAAASALLISSAIVLDSRYNLEVTEYELSFENLPPAFEGLHIVHLSDLHGWQFGKDNIILIEKIRELKPDIIAITGDMTDNVTNIHAFENLLKGIYKLAPIYYVHGNHEWGGLCTEEVAELLGKFGANNISNDYLPLYKNGERIIMAAADDALGPADQIKPTELIEKLREEYPDDFVLMLGHRNYWLQKYPQLPIDLVLSGHAHGGIVRMPFVGGLLDVSRSMPAKHENGVYEGENYTMLVSRGLGNSIIVPRFLNRPEIVSLKLYKS